MDTTAILLVIIILILLYMLFCTKKNNKAQISDSTSSQVEEPNEDMSADTDRQNAKKSSKSHTSNTRKTSKMKWRNRMLDISMIPKTVELDRKNLLPKSIKRQYEHGRRFNAFVLLEEDFFYHRSTCHNIKGKPHKVTHRYMALQEKFPCPDCMPTALIDEWYIKFLNVNFGVDITRDDNAYKNLNKELWLPNTALPEHERTELLN